MTKKQWEAVRKKLDQTPKDVLKKAIRVDGHTIYDPKKFLDAGLDPAVVTAFTKEIRSGSEPKSQISVDGKVVPSVTGVYGLDLLEYIARCFDVTSHKMGRGSRAGDLIEQLEAKLS